MREGAVRGVLVLFAAGLLAACGAGGDKAPPASAPADAESGSIRVYVATYTGGASRGIYLLELDRSSGRFVSGPVLAGETENPSFLALHPNGRFLYAVNELRTSEGKPTGTVSAFAVDPATGRLTFLNRQVSEGTDPCWVVVDAAGKNVLVANYTSGTVAVLPLSPDGRLQPASSVRHGSGSGPVRARQDGPHAHTVVLDAASRFALWTDLGADRVRVDRFDAAAGTLEPNDPGGLALTPGSGPRHLAWHPSGRSRPGPAAPPRRTPQRRSPSLPTDGSSTPRTAATTTSPSSRSTGLPCGSLPPGASRAVGAGRGASPSTRRGAGSSRRIRARVRSSSSAATRRRAFRLPSAPRWPSRSRSASFSRRRSRRAGRK